MAVKFYQAHSETSKEAAESLHDEPGRLSEVLAAFNLFGASGATCEEVFHRLQTMYPDTWANNHYGSASARMATLKATGEIRWKNATRDTTSGNKAEIWVHNQYATDEEREWTAQKVKPKRQIAIETMQQAVNYLESQTKSGAITGNTWIRGNLYNVECLKKAIELIK